MEFQSICKHGTCNLYAKTPETLPSSETYNKWNSKHTQRSVFQNKPNVIDHKKLANNKVTYYSLV